MKRSLTTAAILSLWAGGAFADAFTDQLVAKFQDMGFTFIEVQDGLTQVKIEGIKGSTQLEVVYDRATGRILKQEQERADADDVGRTGVQVRQRNRDFVSVGGPPSAGSVDTNAVVNDLRSQGYNFFEIKRGPTQTKVEAIRGTEQIEIVFDNATGQVLKRETGLANPRDVGRSGVEIDTEDRDFVGNRDRSRSRDDDDRRGRDDDDDDDDHDDDDDSRSESSGSGNSGSGSSNSGSGSSNSGSGSSNSGSGSDDDDDD